MTDPIPTLRTGDAATTTAALPTQIVVTVLVLTFLPYLLNRLGFDFSAIKPPASVTEESILSTAGRHQGRQDTVLGENLHTLLEWSAVSVAAFTVVLAFTHYYIKRDPTTPIIGTALFCSGMLDAFHTLAADGLIRTALNDERFIPFTWTISRGVNACFIAFGTSPFLWNDRAAIDRAD